MKHIIVKILKILGWTLLSVVILVGVLLFCAVKYLDSKNIAPLVEDVANDYIEGHVKISKMRLAFRPKYPILGFEIDSLSVVSHAFDSLTNEERGILPNYADSLLTLDYLTGSLNLKRLIVNNEVAIHDVVLKGLNVNLVIAHNGKANYEVLKSVPDSVQASKSKMPGFRINRFALKDPKEIRFYNASDSTSASVVLLTDAAVDGNDMPTYRLKLSGNVTSPKATLITNLEKINFGLNGKVFWDPAHPGLVAMDDMEIQGAFLRAMVTGKIDLTDSPIVQEGIVDINPVAFTDILSLLPDSIRRLHHLSDPYFSTDAVISGKFELTKPMNLTTDTIPTARISLSVPPAYLRYGKAKFENLELGVTVNTLTNRPDSMVLNVSRFFVEGPGTKLSLSAILSRLVSDPTFDTTVKGQVDLKNLPPIILEKIPGYLSGVITADLHANGSASMFKNVHLHHMVADGSVTANNLYFLSADINNMVEVSKAKIDFNSRQLVDDIPLLHAKVNVDTATILTGGVDIAVGSLKLDVAPEKRSQLPDTTFIEPFCGDLSVNRLNIINITDSAGAKIRNINGRVLLKGVNKGSIMPEILADICPGSVSGGTLSDRILANDIKVKTSLKKLPTKGKKTTSAKPKVNTHREYRYISPDSVFKIVYDRRRHKPGQKPTRHVYTAIGANDKEVLKWNLKSGFRKFLTGWDLKGTVSTNKARLLTPLFPIHNRFSHIDLKFNNDTVTISNISWLVGKSDVTFSGIVTNVTNAMTLPANNTLKANLLLFSDTIDINEISAGVFTGATYAESRRHEKRKIIATADDDALQSRLDAFAKEGVGKMHPVLIPVNIDANLRLDAKNMLYSDLLMQNMGGDILVYDGGVNLHKMRANSDAGDLTVSALYSAPNTEDMHVGFGMALEDFNIGKFVKLVPAIDSIVPLLHDFSGIIDADIAATCRIDSGMNLNLPTLDAAIRITGDNLAFIDPKKYRTLGKWLGFKNKEDNTIKRMNVEMTVDDGLVRVYPFSFSIDRYRLGIYGSNDIAMNFDYHIAVLKSPIPFKFGINISGNPKKYKVRFGGAKFKEDTAIESVSIVNEARINLIDQIENVFKRGVRNSRFVKVNVARPKDFGTLPDPGLTPSDSLHLIQEGLLEPPLPTPAPDPDHHHKDHHHKDHKHKDKHNHKVKD